MKSSLREELEEEIGDVKVAAKKDYKPERENHTVRERATQKEDAAESLGETRVIKPVGEGVKNKAKEILSDIFPFNED